MDLIHLLQQQMAKFQGSTVLVPAYMHAERRVGLSAACAGKLQLGGSHAQVLELGCGHGLPGIFCASHGAASVHFQVAVRRSSLRPACGPNPNLQAAFSYRAAREVRNARWPLLAAASAHPSVRNLAPPCVGAAGAIG